MMDVRVVGAAMAACLLVGCGDDGEAPTTTGDPTSAGSSGGPNTGDTGGTVDPPTSTTGGGTVDPTADPTTNDPSTGDDPTTGDPEDTDTATSDTGEPEPLAPGAVRVAVGGGWACAVKTDGTVWCWGSNVYFSLGVTDAGIFQSEVPLQVGTASDYVSVGRGASCAVHSTGGIDCWGPNLYGQSGNGAAGPDQVGPAPFGSFSDYVMQEQGANFNAGLRVDGTIWGAGQANGGYFGPGDADFAAFEVEQVLGDSWSTFAVGAYLLCGVKTDGTLHCVGRSEALAGNPAPDVCPGVGMCSRSLVQIGADTDWQTVNASVGSATVTAVKQDGSYWCWGANNEASCGTGDMNATVMPTKIGSATWKDVAPGDGQTCGVQTDGSLWCWGANYAGQVGNGAMTPENVLAPVQVGGDTDWAEVSPGYLTTCARKTNGKVLCWGHGTEGQLGNGMLMNSASPVEVLGF